MSMLPFFPSRAALSMAGLLLLSACGKAPQLSHAEYVALGSSFAAGPGVGEREAGSPLLCGRSADNYAHRVARALHLRLRDATCSGATTANILSDRQARQPPQIESVGPEAKLVTITVGGNDISYLGNIAGQSCADARERVPLLWRPVVCKIEAAADVERTFAILPARMAQVVQAVRARAPHARILLVDYNAVLPTEGSCPAASPLDAAQMRAANLVGQRLERITAEVARQQKIALVSASRATTGHDVCAKDPWVNGFVFNRIPLTWGPFAYHPNDKGMQAVAGAILSVFARPAPGA